MACHICKQDVLPTKICLKCRYGVCINCMVDGVCKVCAASAERAKERAREARVQEARMLEVQARSTAARDEPSAPTPTPVTAPIVLQQQQIPWAGIIVAFIVLVFLLRGCGVGGSSSSSSMPGRVEAYGMAKDYVRLRLKSPSTATFPNSADPDVTIVNVGPADWEVRGYVDAENSFGAKLRTRYSCMLHYQGDREWTCSECTLME